MEKEQTSQGRQTKYKTPEPSMYHVIMHNDDVTTMDFVVMVLMRVFRKPQEEAERLMWQIHNEGSALVGTYFYDIAQSKAEYTMKLARANGFPLKLTLEEA